MDYIFREFLISFLVRKICKSLINHVLKFFLQYGGNQMSYILSFLNWKIMYLFFQFDVLKHLFLMFIS